MLYFCIYFLYFGSLNNLISLKAESVSEILPYFSSDKQPSNGIQPKPPIQSSNFMSLEPLTQFNSYNLQDKSTIELSELPTQIFIPTEAPTTQSPSFIPSEAPIQSPSFIPSEKPALPSSFPTVQPSQYPTTFPTLYPTTFPTFGSIGLSNFHAK